MNIILTSRKKVPDVGSLTVIIKRKKGSRIFQIIIVFVTFLTTVLFTHFVNV